MVGFFLNILGNMSRNRQRRYMFEVTYFYHAKDENGKYDTSETKTITKKIGQAFEEVSHDSLASVIIGQLARRDIWIVDVKIYEYTKKEITFKESSDGNGIVIKNRKYTLNTISGALAVSEETPAVQTNMVVQNTSTTPKQNLAVSHNRPIMFVTFDPEIIHVNEIKNFKLTKGKQYAVFKMEEVKAGGMTIQKYSINDDLNRLISIDEKYFTVVGKGLLGDKELGFSEPVNSGRPKLSYSGSYINNQQVQKPAKYANIPLEGEDENYDHLLQNMPVLR